MRTGYDDGVGRLRVDHVVSSTEADTILASCRPSPRSSKVGFTAENGATRLVPGSHNRPDLQRRSGGLDRHDDQIRLTGPVGCGFVINGHALHAGATSDSSGPRPALQFVFRVTDRFEDS